MAEWLNEVFNDEYWIGIDPVSFLIEKDLIFLMLV